MYIGRLVMNNNYALLFKTNDVILKWELYFQIHSTPKQLQYAAKKILAYIILYMHVL